MTQNHCFAVVVHEGRDHIYQWNLDDIFNLCEDLPQLKKIYNQIEVAPTETSQVNKKLGPILNFPSFTDMVSVTNQVVLLSSLGNVYNIILGKNQKCSHIKKMTSITKIDASYNHFLAL